MLIFYIFDNSMFLGARLLCNYIDVTDSFHHSLTARLALSAMSPLFFDQFGRFCHLKFDKEAFSSAVFRLPLVIYQKNAKKSLKLSIPYLRCLYIDFYDFAT